MNQLKHTTRRRVDSLDEESHGIVYGGANISQLAIMFKMDNRTVAQKLFECPPTGERNGTATWKLSVAGPYLIKPILEVEDYIRNMHPSELPKHLSKEYWAAQNSRLEVMRKEGDLWPTERVIATIGDLMKHVKIATKLMNDQVDTQAELTPPQRRIIKQLNDSMLNQLFHTITEAFKIEPVNDTVTELANAMIERARQQPAEDDDEL